MKNAEELNALRQECETMGQKLAELTEDELQEVAGGVVPYLAARGLTLQGLIHTVVTGYSQGGAMVGSPAALRVISGQVVQLSPSVTGGVMDKKEYVFD